MERPSQKWEEALRDAIRNHNLESPQADRTVRLAASIADVALFLVLVSILNKLLRAGEVSIFGDTEVTSWEMRGFILCALMVFYFGVATQLLGGTLGKISLGLKVIRTDGGSLRVGTALLRELVFKYGLLLFSLGFVHAPYLLGWRASPIYDDWLGTTVKRVRGKR